MIRKSTNATSFIRRSCMIGAIIAASGSTAVADPDAHDYCVEHDFNIRTRGNLPPHLVLKHREFAWARCARLRHRVDERGIDPVGLGVTTFTAEATAGGTVSKANSQADVATLAVGTASGEISVFGDVDLCTTSRSAAGRAASAARLYYRGRGMDRRGRIGWVGRWHAEPGIQDGVGKVRRVDPIIGRVFDRTTGTMTEHLMMDIDNFVQGGTFEWDNDRVTNDATTMCFRIEMPGDVTTEEGELIIKVENGRVTESSATGFYSGVRVPPVGAPSTFAFDLENEAVLEFDMPGDDDHELDVEIEMGGAGEHEEAAGVLAGDAYITTALDKGADLAPVYQVPDFAPMGVQFIPGETSIAQPFIVPPDQTWTADQMVLRMVQPNGDPVVPFETVFVRLWQGTPGPTGAVIAGDLDTNRLIATEFTGIHAVRFGDEASQANPIHDAIVDLAWLPTLLPGEYHIEVAALGVLPDPILLPPSPFPPIGPWQPALVGFGGIDFQPLLGHDGLPATAPILIFGDDGMLDPCRADLDGDGRLTIFDFLEYQNLFAIGDIVADFDGDGRLTIFDFLAYQNEFAAGCP